MGEGESNNKQFCFKISMIIITFDFGVDKGAQFKSKRGGIHTVHTVQVSIALFHTEYWCLFYFIF